MGAKRDFDVKVIKTEVVAAVLPMQEHWLPQSNLDLLLPPVDVGVFFCYQNPIMPMFSSFGSVVKILKVSLAETLVTYYAFAGELVQNLSGEPEILCNNSGVNFIEAWAEVDLKEIDFYNPDESIEGKLVPKKKHGVLAIQVTQLKCGGIVVACTFDHRVADAYSANMFLVSWSELAQSKPLSQLPSFRKSFLFPRRPSYHDPLIDNMYLPISALKQETTNADADDQVIISRIYYVKADEIAYLQSLANSTSKCHRSSTKLESFSAFLWKTIASGILEKSDEKATNYKKTFRFGIVVNGRSRLSYNGDENKVELLKGYFGNVLSIPFGEKKVEELSEKPLSWVASAIHEFLKHAVTKEHFLGLIDWMENHRPEPALARIYAKNDDAPAVVVSSGQQFPVKKIEFGWGEPVFGSYHFPWEGKSGYVMPMPSPKGNGDWIVYMHLLKEQLDLVEATASHVFKPLTADYLNLK